MWDTAQGMASPRPDDGPYPRLLGARWRELPEGLRRLHSARRLAGAFDIEPGGSGWARLLQRLLRLPRQAARVPVTVEIRRANGVEVWRRQIGDWRLETRASEVRGRLREAFGPLEFEFEMIQDAGGLRHQQLAVRLRLLGLSVPIPRPAAPRVEGEEKAVPPPHAAEVAVRLAAPGGAPLIAYRGLVSVVE